MAKNSTSPHQLVESMDRLGLKSLLQANNKEQEIMQVISYYSNLFYVMNALKKYKNIAWKYQAQRADFDMIQQKNVNI